MFYKALGYVVWKAAKRYARRRAPSGRSLVVGAAAAGVVAIAAVAAAKRDKLLP
jgi:hypothetical protein